MSIVLVGSTSGSCTLQEQAIAGNTVLTLPTTSGTVALTSQLPTAPSAVGQIPFSTDGSTYTPTAKIVSATAVASTSGTSIDFTGIPSWVKRITVMYDGVSTNGTGEPQIQLGTSGGVQTTGYTGSYGFFGASQAASTSSTGFILFLDGAASYTYTGTAVFTLLASNVWTMTAVTGMNITYVGVCAGSKSLGATLDRVRITTNTGTDLFDAGTINILYE